MANFYKTLTRPWTSQAFDTRLGQFACWFAAMMVLVLGMLKISRLSLNETELFFGLLLVLNLSLLLVVMGIVLPLATYNSKKDALTR